MGRKRSVSLAYLCTYLALILALLATPTWAQEKPAEKPKETGAQVDATTAIEPRLLKVKRVCVYPLGDDALGIQVQEMVIARLFQSKRFSLTENCARADFVLKGSITERSDRSYRAESEGMSFGASAASDSSRGAASGGAHETLSSSEAKQQAAVTLRLVDKEGEILWATSQESTGGKTKGAIGDAAERAVRKFLRDLERAEQQDLNSAAKKP